MEWRCAECKREYDDPPETCVCGSSNLQPSDEGDGRSRFSLLALRKRLVDPKNADRSLVREEPYVTVAFRVLVAITLLVLVFVVLWTLF